MDIKLQSDEKICFKAITCRYKFRKRSKVQMDIEKEITVAYMNLLINKESEEKQRKNKGLKRVI